MPYSVPTPPPASLTSPPLPTHSMGRPGHRRSYSAFSDERGPGTFTSLGALPRRKTPPTSATAKRFHFGRQSGEDDTTESSSDDDDENARRDYAAAAGIPPLKLKVQQNAYPFPKSSPTHSPMLSPLSGLPPTLASSPASTTNPKFLAPPVRPSPSRTASSPILLSNGKPLKSSLKSSSSTSNIPAQNPNNNNNSNPPHQSSFHVRARSAPSTPADLLSSSNSSPSPPNSSYGTPMSSGSPSEQHSPTSSTVSTPKNVHFPSLPTDLEHVRVFNRTARPASLLLPRTSSHQLGGREGEEGTGAEETETETERETDRDTENERERERESFAAALSFGGYGNFGNARGRHVAHLRGSHSMQPPQRVPRWSTGMVSPPTTHPQVGNAYPFPPKLPSMSLPLSKPKSGKSVEEEGRYELDLGTQQIPHEASRNPYVNVALESLSLSSEGKVALEGTLLVRNLAFEKNVFVRFTLDEWATVSEVRAGYVESLNVAGKELPEWLRPKVTVGDVVASLSLSDSASASPGLTSSSSGHSQDQWDRFAFSINLSDYAHARSLHTHSTQLVARFSCNPQGGGQNEWWDNAGGMNYRVGYRWVVGPALEASSLPQVVAPQVKIQHASPPSSTSLSSASPAPPTLSLEPITTTFSASSSNPPDALSDSPTSTSTSIINNGVASASSTSATGLIKASIHAPSHGHQYQSALSAATNARLRRFSLSNYVAPGGTSTGPSTTATGRERSSTMPAAIGGGHAEKEENAEEGGAVSTVAFPSVEDKAEAEVVKSEDEKKPTVPTSTAGAGTGLGLGSLGLYWPWGSSSSTASSQEKEVLASATVEVLSPSTSSSSPSSSSSSSSSTATLTPANDASVSQSQSETTTGSGLVFGNHNRDSSNSSIASTVSSQDTVESSLSSLPSLIRSGSRSGNGSGSGSGSGSGTTSTSSSVSNSIESLDSWFEGYRYGYGSPGSVEVSVMDMGMGMGMSMGNTHLEGFDFDHTHHVHAISHDGEEDHGHGRDVKTPTPASRSMSDGRYGVGVPLGDDPSSSSSSGTGSSPIEETSSSLVTPVKPTTTTTGSARRGGGGSGGGGYFDRSGSGASSAGSGSETEIAGTPPVTSTSPATTTTTTATITKPMLNLEGLKHLRALSDPSRLSPYSLSSPRLGTSPKVSPRISPRVSPGTSPKGSPLNRSPRTSFIGPSPSYGAFNVNSPSYGPPPIMEGPERLLSPRPNPAEINSDSLYQAFVKQWCFAGSGPGSENGNGNGLSPGAGVGEFEVGA